MKKMLALALALMLVFALAACGGNSAAETAPAAPEAPAAEAPAAPEAPAAEAPAAPEAPAAEAPAAPEGDASGEPSGDPMPANGEMEITVDGVTGTATFEETDNGDQATKGLSVTWNGQTYTGAIDKGVYTADDAVAQPIFDALQQARSAAGTGEPSGEPSGEPQP